MKPFLVVKAFSNLPSPHNTSNQRRLLFVPRPPPATPPPSPITAHMQMRAWEQQQAQQSRRGSAGSVTTIAAVATTTETTHQPPPTPPPLPPVPPQPQRRRRNRCPCSECCVHRESNTPGKCSFHAMAAVVVDTATTAITITNHPRGILPPSTPPTPPPAAAAEIAMITINPADVAIAAVSTQSYYAWGAVVLRNGACGGITGGGGGRREGAFARPLLPGKRKRYGRGRAEPRLGRPAAGVRGRAPDHYSRGSGGVKEGARKGVTGGGMPPGAGRRRDERCRDRRGERRSHG